MRNSSDDDSSKHEHYDAVPLSNLSNETYYMFYNAVGEKSRGIGLITSKPIILTEDTHDN